jgi:hypothetical protein
MAGVSHEIWLLPFPKRQGELQTLRAGDSIRIAIAVVCHAVLWRGRGPDHGTTCGTDGGTSKNRSCAGTGSSADNGTGCSTKAAANQRTVSLAARLATGKGGGRESHQQDLFHFVNL